MINQNTLFSFIITNSL